LPRMRQALHQEGVEPALLHCGMPQKGGPRAVEAARSQAARGAQGEAATRVGSVPWPRLPERLPQEVEAPEVLLPEVLAPYDLLPARAYDPLVQDLRSLRAYVRPQAN